MQKFTFVIPLQTATETEFSIVFVQFQFYFPFFGFDTKTFMSPGEIKIDIDILNPSFHFKNFNL
jgi:hypothetical protein